MSLKKYRHIALFAMIINLISIFTSVFAIWSLVLLILSIFIINNRDSEMLLKDKKIYGFIQAFMLCVFTFMFSVMGFQFLPIALYFVHTYLAAFKYPFIVLGVIGLIIYYYLSIKLLIEAVNVVRKKETLS